MTFTKKPCLNRSEMTQLTYCDGCNKDKVPAEDQKTEQDSRPWFASGFGSDVYNIADLYGDEPTTELMPKSTPCSGLPYFNTGSVKGGLATFEDAEQKTELKLKSTPCSGLPYFNTGGVKDVLRTLKALSDAGTPLPPIEDGRIRDVSVWTMSKLGADSEPSHS